MNKKVIYSILSVIVAMVVLSVSLVFAIGPLVSADSDVSTQSRVIVMDEERYFDIDENGIFHGYTEEGKAYSDGYNKLLVVFPDTVTSSCNGYAQAGNGVGGGWGSQNYSEIFYFIPNSVSYLDSDSFSDSTVFCEATEKPEGWDSCWDVDPNSDYPCATYFGCVLCDGIVYGISDDGLSYSVLACFKNEDTVTIKKTIKNKPVTTICSGVQYMSYFAQRFAYTFDYCDKISRIDIPDSITSIYNHAFYNRSGLSSLNSVIIPDSVIDVGYDIFKGCSKLTKVYCETENPAPKIAPDGWCDDWNTVRSYYAQEENEWKREFPDVIWNCNRAITFNTNGGSIVEDQKVCVDHYAVAPENPTRENYVFQYWYTTDENTLFDFENEQVTDNMTLIAKWEEVQAQPEPETPVEENLEVNNQNNAGLIWGITGTSAGVLIIAGIVVGIVIAKRRRK